MNPSQSFIYIKDSPQPQYCYSDQPQKFNYDMFDQSNQLRFGDSTRRELFFKHKEDLILQKFDKIEDNIDIHSPTQQLMKQSYSNYTDSKKIKGKKSIPFNIKKTRSYKQDQQENTGQKDDPQHHSQPENKKFIVDYKNTKNNNGFLKIQLLLAKIKQKFLSLLKQRRFFQLEQHHFNIINDQAYFPTHLGYNVQAQKKCNSQEIFKLIEDFFIVLPVFQPNQYQIICWQFVILILILYYLFQIPLYFTFAQTMPNDFVYYIGQLIFSINLLINFNTGYYEEGVIVMDRKKIILNQIRWHLFIEVGTIVSINLQNNYLLIIIFLFRIPEITNLINDIDEWFQITEKFYTITELMKLAFLIFYLAHYVACGFIYIAQDQEVGQSWIDKLGLENVTTAEQYVNGLYFAFILMLTIGFGDITPKTQKEKIFIIIIAQIGCGIFGYAINTIGAIFQQRAIKQNNFKLMKYDIKNYMKNRNIHDHIQVKVIKFLEYNQSTQNQGLYKQKGEVVLNQLSSQLKDELYRNFYGQILLKNKFFGGNFSSKFLNDLALIMQEITLAPGELIYRKGDIDNRLFFINKGSVESYTELISSEREVIYATFSQGDFIGEQSFFTNQLRETNLRCKTTTHLIYCNCNDFLQKIKNYQLDFERQQFERLNRPYVNSFRDKRLIQDTVRNTRVFIINEANYEYFDQQKALQSFDDKEFLKMAPQIRKSEDELIIDSEDSYSSSSSSENEENNVKEIPDSEQEAKVIRGSTTSISSKIENQKKRQSQQSRYSQHENDNYTQNIPTQLVISRQNPSPISQSTINEIQDDQQGQQNIQQKQERLSIIQGLEPQNSYQKLYDNSSENQIIQQKIDSKISNDINSDQNSNHNQDKPSTDTHQQNKYQNQSTRKRRSMKTSIKLASRESAIRDENAQESSYLNNKIESKETIQRCHYQKKSSIKKDMLKLKQQQDQLYYNNQEARRFSQKLKEITSLLQNSRSLQTDNSNIVTGAQDQSEVIQQEFDLMKEFQVYFPGSNVSQIINRLRHTKKKLQKKVQTQNDKEKIE